MKFVVPLLWLACLASATAYAQVKVEHPWVRGAVPGQLTTGAFFDLTSPKDAAVVKVESPVAGIAEVHTSEMKGNLMRMRAVPSVPLPAGKTVRFAPGGYHVMLMDLKRPVKNGEVVPITLTVEYPDRKQEKVEVKAEVRALGATPQHQHQP
jgi:copper(I)-binding protein